MTIPKGPILITAGGTREYIDRVRYLANGASGLTGLEIANFFLKKDIEVDFVLGSENKIPLHLLPPRVYRVNGVEDLLHLLPRMIKGRQYSGIFMTMAISDFLPEVSGKLTAGQPVFFGKFKPNQKLESTEDWILTLKRAPKIISNLRRWTGKKTKIFGFKYLYGVPQEELFQKALEQIGENKTDFCFANDGEHISQNHRGFILSKKGEPLPVASNQEMAAIFFDLIGFKNPKKN